jgi:hypothetical protein
MDSELRCYLRELDQKLIREPASRVNSEKVSLVIQDFSHPSSAKQQRVWPLQTLCTISSHFHFVYPQSVISFTLSVQVCLLSHIAMIKQLSIDSISDDAMPKYRYNGL